MTISPEHSEFREDLFLKRSVDVPHVSRLVNNDVYESPEQSRKFGSDVSRDRRASVIDSYRPHDPGPVKIGHDRRRLSVRNDVSKGNQTDSKPV